MIITLTGNLLAERTLRFSGWTVGKTQRAAEETFQVGGKGINVVKMLQRLNHPSSAWCFSGGAAGEECEMWLEKVGLPHRVFSTSAATRTGLVVRSNDLAETTFLAPDRAPDAAALQKMAEAIRETCEQRQDALFALCGSFPGWNDPGADRLHDALAACARGGNLVADSYGPPLRWLRDQPVTLVKINRQEFDGLFSISEQQQPVLDRISVALKRWPVRSWIITDGAEEICFGDLTTAPAAVRPPSIQEVSATGSGDVFFAALLHELRSSKASVAQAIDFAMPFGAANAAHPGVAEFDLNLLPPRRSVLL